MAAPLTASQMIAALKAEGLTVKEYSLGDKSWRENTRTAKTRPWGPVNGVMIHHTASGTEGIVKYCFQGTGSLPGPLCHAVIDKAGVVWMVGHGRCNHAGGGDRDVLNAVIAESYASRPPATNEHEGSAGAVDGNARFYGFECVNQGDGKDPWPKVQYVAMVKAAAALCRAHDNWGSKSVIFHREWSDWKPDPKGLDAVDFRADVADCLKAKPKAWPPVKAAPIETTLVEWYGLVSTKLNIPKPKI